MRDLFLKNIMKHCDEKISKFEGLGFKDFLKLLQIYAKSGHKKESIYDTFCEGFTERINEASLDHVKDFCSSLTKVGYKNKKLTKKIVKKLFLELPLHRDKQQ